MAPDVFERLQDWMRWAMTPVGRTTGIYSPDFFSSIFSFFFLFSICLAVWRFLNFNILCPPAPASAAGTIDIEETKAVATNARKERLLFISGGSLQMIGHAWRPAADCFGRHCQTVRAHRPT